MKLLHMSHTSIQGNQPYRGNTFTKKVSHTIEYDFNLYALEVCSIICYSIWCSFKNFHLRAFYAYN